MDTNIVNTNRQLLGEIRERLQDAHFSARGIKLIKRHAAQEPLADQLHAIRVLAEELANRLQAGA